MKTYMSYFLSKHHFTVIAFSLIFTLLVTGCGSRVKNPDVLLKNAVTSALNKGRWQESLKYAKEASSLAPQDENVLAMYALALEQNGQLNTALKQLRKAVAIAPQNFLIQLSLGRCLYAKGDFEGAYEYLYNAYNLRPDNIDALVLLAQCSAKLQAQNTDKLFLKLAKTKYFKNKPEIYNELGAYYTETRNLSKAAQCLSTAYKLAPNNPIITSNLGVFCDHFLNQPRKAMFFYRKFLTLTNDNQAFNSQRKQVIDRIKQIR